MAKKRTPECNNAVLRQVDEFNSGTIDNANILDPDPSHRR